VIYLDNIFIMDHSKRELIQLTSLVCRLFEAQGLMVNREISQLVPKQGMELLGFLVNSTSLNLGPQLRK